MKLKLNDLLRDAMRGYHASVNYPFSGDYDRIQDRWAVRIKSLAHIPAKNWGKIGFGIGLLGVANSHLVDDVQREFFTEISAGAIGISLDPTGITTGLTLGSLLATWYIAGKYDKQDEKGKSDMLYHLNKIVGTGLVTDVAMLPLDLVFGQKLRDKISEFFKKAPTLKLVHSDLHQFSYRRQVVNYLSALTEESKDKLIDIFETYFNKLNDLVEASGNPLLIKMYHATRDTMNNFKDALKAGREKLFSFFKGIGDAINGAFVATKDYLSQTSQDALDHVNQKHAQVKDGDGEHTPLEAMLTDSPEASNESPGVSPAPPPKDDTVVDIAGRVKAFRDRHNIQPPKGMAM